MTGLPPTYNPKDVEERIYTSWEEQQLFQADVDPARRPYTIVIPPPNITGILHMGHALNSTIQDVLIRFQRMQGGNALWIPGTDHAGIATQNVVEKALAKEGTRRQDLGRDAFIQRVWQWKEEHGNTIIGQLKRLGASCDWRRTRFTMDDGLSNAVTDMFMQLYKKGLIYRGTYIINWCPRCQTALSDEEAPRQATAGKLYHVRYPLEVRATARATATARTPAFIEVATTRPETMLGDTAVAVHPKDRRYKALIGKTVVLPLVNRRLPIIADELVDRAFGTGAVKVTPAHDPADFAMGKKHKLEFINVMTDDAKMTGVPEAYAGLDRFECRSKLIVDLERAGVLGAIEEHQHNVGHCYRCHTMIEPRLSPQWFVKMTPLAKPAIKAVKDGTITFSPARWKKVYLNWMENIHDWCISRQIWWGHRIPVWYCDACLKKPRRGTTGQPGVIVAKTAPTQCPRCRSTALRQDDDVLDTWFSSWLWPVSTLGWPAHTPELKYFYPTNALVTAPEIIFFWVARMIMAGYFCMQKPPFTDVYIHGTVRDVTGKKMSKSLGNVIDPLVMIDHYGTDALRYTLVTATAIGQDLFLSEERFANGRNFANKLWNATRFVLAQGSPRGSAGLPSKAALSIPDRWILSRLQGTAARVTKALQSFQINDAANTLYDFIWRDFCDWYVEIAKIQLREDRAASTVQVLTHVLTASLRLLHPIMPFVTEELSGHIADTGTIMRGPWPKPERRRIDAHAEQLLGRLQRVVSAVRNTRSELNIPPESRPPIHIAAQQPAVRAFFTEHQVLMQTLARVGTVQVSARSVRPVHAAATVVDGVEIIMPLEGIIDVVKERTRLQQRVDALKNDLSGVEARLRDRQFTRKAPAQVIDQVKQRREQLSETVKKMRDYLAMLN